MPDDRVWIEITPTGEQDRDIALAAAGEIATQWLTSFQSVDR
jgi:hypothetical protein